MVESFTRTYYEELADAATYATPDKPDFRRTTDVSGQRDLSTTCGILSSFGTPQAFDKCRWGKPASNTTERCYYLRFGFMCDKLLDSQGKEIN